MSREIAEIFCMNPGLARAFSRTIVKALAHLQTRLKLANARP
jgi:hypothetical protein